MTTGPAEEQAYLNARLHEVDLPLLDVEGLVDLGH
jgi:hypothetical protein